MNENELFEAIGETGKEMLEASEEYRKPKNSWVKIVGAAAAVCLVAAGAIALNTITDNPGTATEIPDGATANQTTAAAADNFGKSDAGNVQAGTYTEDNMTEYSPETRALLLSGAVYPDMPQYPVEFSDDFDSQYKAWDTFNTEHRVNTPKDYKDSSNHLQKTA